jgi:hypothetical protein
MGWQSLVLVVMTWKAVAIEQLMTLPISGGRNVVL